MIPSDRQPTPTVLRRLLHCPAADPEEVRVASIDELMAQIPMADVAARLGVSESEAEQAVRAFFPLIGGMEANTADPSGAASLARAIGQHDGSLLEGGVRLDDVDTDDGSKIVSNVFGANEGAVVNQLGGLGGLNAGTITKLLPILAPLLMSFLGKSFGSGGARTTSGGSGMGPAESDAGTGGGLGGLLGGLLGGGGGGLGGLGDVLGGLHAGGKR